MTQKKQLEVIIEKFSGKGHGIAFTDSGRVLIEKTAVGDMVLAELNKKSKGYIKGKILRIISPSAFRREPVCGHFEMCGGCGWQHLKYEEQLNQKQNQVLQNFDEYIKKNKTAVYPIEKCENIFEYRNKMEFSFSENQKGTKYLGLVMRTQRFVMDIERCYLAGGWFSLVLKQVKKWWEKYNFSAFNFRNGLGFLRTLTIKEGKNTQDKMVVLTASDSSVLTKEQKNDFISSVTDVFEKPCNLSIYLNTQRAKKGVRTSFDLEKLYGNDFIVEDLYIKTFDELIRLSFHIGPLSFFQPNTHQAQRLYSLVLSYLLKEDLKEKVVFDLYAGTGTIGMILAKFAKKTLAVELNEDAYNQALKNARLNNIENFQIVNEDVSALLKKIISKDEFNRQKASENDKTAFDKPALEKPDIIVVDPPRAGLAKEAVWNILRICPKTIIYISCSVKTQADDIKIFTSGGYQLKILHPVDQFPHTFHIENIAVLERA